ncbi:MAG: NotI family restriction endonuclease [Dehalococcoidia bacterium]
MPNHPLAEIFGFPANNLSKKASRYRKNRLCPFNNRVPNCTKDKANAPLGVCSIYDEKDVVITCPIRFRQDWIIAEDAADFFFPGHATWTSLTEVRLNDKNGKSAGNIDIVLVSYDQRGRISDYGALEVQAVYISGNVRRPFEYYMDDAPARADMDWRQQSHYPRPDYVSSSRKRLAPQLIYKGGILKAWQKKIAVASNRGFYQSLPELEEVDKEEADVAWLVYDLQYDSQKRIYALRRHSVVYTHFETSLEQITRSEPGREEDFVGHLQSKLDEKLEDGFPPDAPTLDELQ